MLDGQCQYRTDVYSVCHRLYDESFGSILVYLSMKVYVWPCTLDVSIKLR